MNNKKNSQKTRFYNIAKISLFLGILLILSSCSGVKPGSTKAGNNLFETFFVGEEGSQYFIKPLVFNSDSNEYLELDLSFRHKKEVKDSAIVNISFINNDIFKNVNQLKLSNGITSIVSKEIDFLFAERKKDMFNCRFSVKISLIELKSLFENNNWNIEANKKEVFSNYTATNSTKKKIDKLNYNIFKLF